MKQAGFVPILILILVAVVVLGGYLVYRQTTQPSPTSDPTQITKPPKNILIPVESNTYSNKLFSLELPIGWYISQENNDYVQLVNYDIWNAPQRGFSPIDDKGFLKIEIYAEETNKKLQDFVWNEEGKIQQTNITLDGQQAKKIKSDGYSVVYAKHPNKNIILTIYFHLDFENYQDLLNQILSTFKFTQ